MLKLIFRGVLIAVGHCCSSFLTSFNSLLYKQFLNNAKSIEATPEEGFSEIKFDKKGSFISEFQKFTIEGLELEDFNKIGNKYVS